MAISLRGDAAGGKGYIQVDGVDAVEVGQQYLKLPNGTTAQRPTTGSTAMLRYNTTTGTSEFHNGTDWYKVADPIQNISNLVSYYPLTAASLSSGQYLDYKGGYHLTKYGSLLTNVTDSRFGSVVDFTDPGATVANDYLRSSSWRNLTGSAGISVSIWIKSPVTTSSSQWIISEGAVNSRWNVFFESNIKWRSQGSGDVMDDVQWLDNTWHHICITYNNTNNAVVIYVDNNVVTTGTGTGNLYAGEYLLVGQHSTLGGNAASYRWRGKMCALRIYDKVLTSSEVQTLYGEF